MFSFFKLIAQTLRQLLPSHHLVIDHRRSRSSTASAQRTHRNRIAPSYQRHWRWFCAVAVCALIVVTGPLNRHLALNASALTLVQAPLSTRGTQIIDRAGQPVLLRGVNWFGIETEMHAPHGLWRRDYKAMLSQIKRLGYNVIRLPYSIESLRASQITGVDFNIGSNRDLQGKTPLEAMDIVIQAAEQEGLMILLDSHRLNSNRIPELWYGDGYTETDWINTWTMLAQRYRNQANIIGADLKNEPHGRASWGTGDQSTDWRLAAERAGNAILAVNPNWLIVVEGVEKNVPGQVLSGHWQGGNLEGVRRFPVRLSRANKLVYSPHEYGQGVFNQPWFNEPNFPQNLRSRWETGFNYIATQGIAPILVGEFGGRQVDRNSKEGIWQRQFVDFIRQQDLSFAYWSWNPNSDDTGGILLDDWQTIDRPKQDLLNQLLPAPTLPSRPSPSPNPSPSPSPSPTPSSAPRPSPSPSPISTPSPTPTPASTPTPTPTPTPSSGASNGSLRAESLIQSDWQTGFCVSLRVSNPSRTAVSNWRLRFQMNQADINNSWNGGFSRQGSQYTVTPPEWGRVLQPSQTIDMGFCANKRGPDYLPRQVSVSQ